MTTYLVKKYEIFSQFTRTNMSMPKFCCRYLKIYNIRWLGYYIMFLDTQNYDNYINYEYNISFVLSSKTCQEVNSLTNNPHPRPRFSRENAKRPNDAAVLPAVNLAINVIAHQCCHLNKHAKRCLRHFITCLLIICCLWVVGPPSSILRLHYTQVTGYLLKTCGPQS